MERCSIPQISTGDIIRLNIQQQTTIGQRFQQMVAEGQYVPDEVVNAMVATRLDEPDCVPGFILDGFPRTLPQANWLDGFLAKGDSAVEEPKPDAVPQFQSEGVAHQRLPLVAVSIQVRYDELLRRITGRRTGSVSKRIYNIYTNPPIAPGMCDIDGEPLVQRPDDTEEVFTERMRVFEAQTAPVIAHYRQLGRFQEVDGERSVDDVTEQVLTALRCLRGN